MLISPKEVDKSPASGWPHLFQLQADYRSTREGSKRASDDSALKGMLAEVSELPQLQVFETNRASAACRHKLASPKSLSHLYKGSSNE